MILLYDMGVMDSRWGPRVTDFLAILYAEEEVAKDAG